MPSRVQQGLMSVRDLVRAYNNIYSLANWMFAKNREKRVAEMLNNKKISMTYGVLTMKSSYYEEEIINILKRGRCRRKDPQLVRKCISDFIKKSRLPDVDLEIRGNFSGQKFYRLTFVELGTSDRYYYKNKKVVKDSPAGIVLDVLNGRKAGKVVSVESKIVFDPDIAREYIEAMKTAGKFNIKNYIPRKSTMPRIEYEKIEHFLKPVPDLKKRVVGGVPVYFGYYFSDDVVLFMSFPEIAHVGTVQSENVITFGQKRRSKNIIVEARNMKPLEILAIERMFGVIVNVTDTKGDATINGRQNSYRINWVAKVDWRNGRILRRINVNAKPGDLEDFYLLVKSVVNRLK